MSANVKDRIVEIIAEQALMDVDDIQLDAGLDSLGVDSLGLVESIFAIEEEFDIQIPFNANDPTASDFDITSVSAIISAVEALVQQKT